MTPKKYKRILEPPKGSFFLFGPRGTGKSTWLRATFPSAHTIDLLSEARYQSYLSDAGLFADEVRATDPDQTIVVDEVQRLPNLLNEVHRAIEDRGQRFVLCGSSARKLKAQGVNLLAGRAVRRSMHPLLPEELGADFDLQTALTTGTIPLIQQAPEPEEALGAYVQMYLKEEIQAEALVRNLPGFARFLPVAALFHGQVLNTSSLARDAGVARTTITGYLDILEDTLLAFRLPAFEAKLRVRERRHPKLYWVDAGLVRAVLKRTAAPTPDERGHLLEGLIAGLLRAYRGYRAAFDSLSYWASSQAKQVEVDFVARRGDATLAIEVKSGSGRPDGKELKGLRAIAALDGVLRRILVYTGEHKLITDDGIEVLPVGDFLRQLSDDALFVPSSR